MLSEGRLCHAVQRNNRLRFTQRLARSTPISGPASLGGLRSWRLGQDAYAALAGKRGVLAGRSKGEFSVADPVEIAKREAHRDAERVGKAENCVRQGVRREDLNRLGTSACQIVLQPLQS